MHIHGKSDYAAGMDTSPAQGSTSGKAPEKEGLARSGPLPANFQDLKKTMTKIFSRPLGDSFAPCQEPRTDKTREELQNEIETLKNKKNQLSEKFYEKGEAVKTACKNIENYSSKLRSWEGDVTPEQLHYYNMEIHETFKTPMHSRTSDVATYTDLKEIETSKVTLNQAEQKSIRQEYWETDQKLLDAQSELKTLEDTVQQKKEFK